MTDLQAKLPVTIAAAQITQPTATVVPEHTAHMLRLCAERLKKCHPFGLFSDERNAGEKETLVQQTVVYSVKHLDSEGRAYSIVALASDSRGLAENSSAYAELVKAGYIIDGTHPTTNEHTAEVTPKLLLRLATYYKLDSNLCQSINVATTQLSFGAGAQRPGLPVTASATNRDIS